ncbi:MAG TPA: hypothetical protein VFF69_16070 [Phycisphaerales bacterium]|nr:hypothetical protein [Phycisphaerales bacterium]
MPTQPTIRRLAMVCLPVLILAALWLAPEALARLSANTIDTTATISDKGRHLVLTGPLTCDRVQWVDLRVTVTQRETGALAEGCVRFIGTPEQQIWTLEAQTKGRNGFVAGPATAVALATSTLNGQTDDAHQWLVDIVLEEGE